jgi:two-component system nitrogen regulation sensor histidine kinase NtrY
LTLTKNIKKYFLPALLVVALAVALFKPSNDNLRSIAKQIQTKLNEDEGVFENAVKGKPLHEAFANGQEESPVIEKLEAQNILLYYYRGDSLVHWTDNSVALLSLPSAMPEGTSFIKLKNGWYQASKFFDSIANETIIGLVPVKYDYPFENKFLTNDFALGLKVPQNIELSEQKIDGSIPVNNVRGELLFSLYVSGDSKEVESNFALLLAQLVLLLIAFYYAQRLAVQIVHKQNFLFGFIFLVLALVAARALMLYFDQPSEFYKLDLFDPKYYASSIITKSLGDLIINSFLIIWLVLFYTRYNTKVESDSKLYSLIRLQNIAFIFAYTWLVWWVFKTLVMDSTISFEVYNILSLNGYSLLGLLCIVFLLVSHFIVTKNIFLDIQQAKVKSLYLVAFTVFAAIVFVVFGFNSFYFESLVFSTLWAAAFVLVFYFMLQKSKLLSVRNLIVYVALYSVLSAFLIENLYERKERNQRKFFSGKLVSERDFVAEYMFEDAVKRIEADGFSRNFFTNPIISKKEVTDRISSLYLSGYFNKYNLQLFAFDAEGNAMRNEDTASIKFYKDLIAHDASPAQALHYINDTTLNYSYLSIISFKNDSSTTGSFVIKLVPKIYYGQNVYPELLLGSNVTVSNNVNNYAYAIYQNDKLIAQYGDYAYSYYWNKDYQFKGGDFLFIEEDDWEHSIQHFSNGKKVVVTVSREPVFEPVATFSYLFTFFFLAVLLLLFVLKVANSSSAEDILPDGFALSFRTRINYSMLAMIVISFIIIGIITISFFSQQYDNFYTDRLLRKEKVIHASLEYFIQKNSSDINALTGNADSELNLEVARMADINSVDINFYNTTGDIVVSSQPIIYDKGLVSKKMNPDAYFELKNNKTAQVTKQESIGELKYLATYAPVRNNKGEAVAYIGIPYFERSKNISDEVSSFLVALMNVYVFLLICAAVLAYFISNSITRPLTIISEKLRILNLNKINEPIEWNSKDEIGVLVNEYNKMIAELEQSAQKLAKGERESAWREMAKQIAHEIKNPLTPMKLSIQYLQRAIDEGHPNINELAKKVTKTLEEQIENLSSIATAFSSFAKMPKAQNEILNLNELLKHIADLFAREENASVTFNTESESPFVFADKNQMVSVFNNLVKNAIQSIPEQRKGFVDVNIKEEDGWITIAVSDNGSGIPSDNYDKVFVPNFTTKSSGTGLGLAITKQIIDGTGGRIWFESAENVGTTFYVRMKKNETV